MDRCAAATVIVIAIIISSLRLQEMWCMHCQTAQPIQSQCRNCSAVVGKYYCSICKLLDNDLSKQIYHCEQCGICRRGPKEDFYHCAKCNTCMDVARRNRHRCLEKILERNCPICGEYLFTSTETVIFMKCGHAIHQQCFYKHAEHSYRCPICNKSLADMSSYFSQLDRMVASQPMPAEYANRRSEIFCNDCELRSEVKYHFLCHKCAHCGSYNTNLLRTTGDGDGSNNNADGNGTSNGTSNSSHPSRRAAEEIPTSPTLPVPNRGYGGSISRVHNPGTTPGSPMPPSIPERPGHGNMDQPTREPRSPRSNSGV
ncbi:hypothetical protein EV182_003296 [Spiromyces aspiralis]|uniref:Uncharacterized protein n=1 Tax=Spiromyces aspiralis TaxID=68401 RepID=A0ACC1HQT4_9FUNG|nr:hypothetical protein EV182_003296 [Spiromyces aspiralis]